MIWTTGFLELNKKLFCNGGKGANMTAGFSPKIIGFCCRY
jgi:hypothetical protein